jgi:hypothetical protein
VFSGEGDHHSSSSSVGSWASWGRPSPSVSWVLSKSTGIGQGGGGGGGDGRVGTPNSLDIGHRAPLATDTQTLELFTAELELGHMAAGEEVETEAEVGVAERDAGQHGQAHAEGF